MTTDDMVMQGARASTAMVVTLVFHNMLVSGKKGWLFNGSIFGHLLTSELLDVYYEYFIEYLPCYNEPYCITSVAL